MRLSHIEDRSYETLESEVQLLLFLKDQPNLRVALPVLSNDENHIERVETELGPFFAVVFEGLEGDMFEIEELEEAQFVIWGRTLGELHQAFSRVPQTIADGRPSFKTHLEKVRVGLPPEETRALKELERLSEWAERLPYSQGHFRLIHYDFELDNLRGRTVGLAFSILMRQPIIGMRQILPTP